MGKLRSRLIELFKTEMKVADYPGRDLSSNPMNFNNFLSPGWCEPKI